jgi:arsenate reductase
MNKEDKKERVLFICTHNSARSQMAEDLLRSLYGDIYDVYSAGNEPSSIRAEAVNVMREIGIDIGNQHSKDVNEFTGMDFEYIVTVCDYAKDTCPFFPGGKNYIHKGFEDPSGFKGNKSERLSKFREIRDEIKEWIQRKFGDEI